MTVDHKALAHAVTNEAFDAAALASKHMEFALSVREMLIQHGKNEAFALTHGISIADGVRTMVLATQANAVAKDHLSGEAKEASALFDAAAARILSEDLPATLSRASRRRKEGHVSRSMQSDATHRKHESIGLPKGHNNNG